MSADSTTKFWQYLDIAEQLQMPAFCFSEHGSVLNWVKKKQEVEKRGMKYIHANEVYLTEHTDKERGLVRDNYHYMLIARNWEGVKELNRLTSAANSKEDGHYYYSPRISFDELFATSDNIIMTSACLASPLWRAIKKNDRQMENRLMEFFTKNKHRMFFEVQYHPHPEQIQFNQWLYETSKDTGIKLIAGTDTHCLNKEHAAARKILMKAKGATYGDEDTFDLTFKTFDELVGMFKTQGAIPEEVYLEAIHNTNIVADMVEEFKLDTNPKYPKLYDNPEEVFKEKIRVGIVERGIDKKPAEEKKKYFERVREEFDTYKKVGAIDYMLLQEMIIKWCHEQGIYQGYGRGSVNGSLNAYLMKITEMDSIKHKLNFFRFLNPERISLADIDIDFPPSRRQEVIDYVATISGIHFAEIITFNTVALKGAIREVGRALNMDLDVVDEIAKAVYKDEKKKDAIDSSYRDRYPELFKYVDVVNGVIMSIGSHPSGFLVSPITLDDNIGLCYTKESKYPVSQINMKELDGLNYVKLDILGLDNIEIINETCNLAGIERLTPDNMDVNDEAVWNSIRESGMGIFQWESPSGQTYLKNLFSPETIEKIKEQNPNFSYIELLSIGNGAIRPSGDSYRYDLAKGIFKDHGHVALNSFLRNTLGYLVYQETIMQFLVDFCGFSMAESDSVRRGLSKKEGTEMFLPEIKKRFIEKMKQDYEETEERAVEIIEPFINVILDAQFYGFSDNHSNPYSHIGYGNGYLRYYYPLEFLSVMLNINFKDKVQTGEIVAYAKSKGIEVSSIKFGKSKASYSPDKESNTIYKGLASIKYLNSKIADELYELRKNKYNTFTELLIDVVENTSVDTRQMGILIKLDFFSSYGGNNELLHIYNEFIAGEHPYKKTHKDKTKNDRKEFILQREQEIRTTLTEKVIPPNEIAMFQKEVLGYIDVTFPHLKDPWCVVTEIDKTYTPKLTLYDLRLGREAMFKIAKPLFNAKVKEEQIEIGSMIIIREFERRNKSKKVNNEWIKLEEKESWVTSYIKYLPTDKEL